MLKKGFFLKGIEVGDSNKVKVKFQEYGLAIKNTFLVDFNAEYESLPYSLGMAYGEGYEIVENLIKHEVLPFLNEKRKAKVNEEDFKSKLQTFVTWDKVFDNCTKKYTTIDFAKTEAKENEIELKVVGELRENMYEVIMGVHDTLSTYLD